MEVESQLCVYSCELSGKLLNLSELLSTPTSSGYSKG